MFVNRDASGPAPTAIIGGINDGSSMENLWLSVVNPCLGFSLLFQWGGKPMVRMVSPSFNNGR